MTTLRYTCLAILAARLLMGDAQAMNSAAVDEVLKLNKAGLGDDAVVAFIRNKNANYDLSSDDIVLLKNQGVSSAILAAMLGTGGGAQPVAMPSPAPVPAPPAPSTIPTAPTVAPPPNMAPSPVVQSPTLSPDAAYFYQQLSPYGRWLLADDNQWYWQPSVATATWQPYSDQGHWVYTDSGWYWASDYP